MLPTWEQLATSLKGEVNVGVVDCIQSPNLKTRFEIKGFPSIYFFSQEGKSYKYSGARDIEKFTEFARVGFTTAEATKVKPPAEKGPFDFVNQIGVVPLVLGIAVVFIVVLVFVCLIPSAPKAPIRPVGTTAPTGETSEKPAEATQAAASSEEKVAPPSADSIYAAKSDKKRD